MVQHFEAKDAAFSQNAWSQGSRRVQKRQNSLSDPEDVSEVKAENGLLK